MLGLDLNHVNQIELLIEDLYPKIGIKLSIW